MTKAALLIADISDYQENVDMAAYKKAGHVRIRIKCTQGTGSAQRLYRERVEAAHTVGLAVDHYHYLTAEDGAAQADWFIANLRLKPGDRLMDDAEAAGVNGTIVSDFTGRCREKNTDVAGLTYGSPYFLRDHGIRSTHGFGLCLADYTTNKTPIMWPGGKGEAYLPGFDGVPFEWQFTETARTAGISGASDLSRVVRAAKQPKPRKPLSSWTRKVSDWFIAAAKRRVKAGNPLTDLAVQRMDQVIVWANKLKEIK